MQLYNAFNVYSRELAPGTVSLTGDRAQGDDSKHWAYSSPYSTWMTMYLPGAILDIFSYQRTLGFVRRAHLRFTLFMRGDVSSISHKLSTTSLVVTCDSVNSLLGNHMKSLNKVIFSKLIFFR